MSRKARQKAGKKVNTVFQSPAEFESWETGTECLRFDHWKVLCDWLKTTHQTVNILSVCSKQETLYPCLHGVQEENMIVCTP